MTVPVPLISGIDDAEYEKRVCQTRRKLERALDMAERVGTEEALRNYRRVREVAIKELREAEIQFGESFATDNANQGRGLPRRGREFIASLIRTTSNNQIDVVNYTKNVIRAPESEGGLGDVTDDVNLWMAQDQAVGISSEYHLSTQENILEPMFDMIAELSRAMGLKQRTLGGREYSDAEQALIVADFWVRMKDELSGANETQAMRYYLPLRNKGNQERATVIDNYLKNHRDPDRVNAELDALVTKYGLARPYQRQFDPMMLVHLRDKWKPYHAQLDQISDQVNKLRIRSLELGRAAQKVGDEDLLLIKAYGLEHYLPNKGEDRSWSHSRDLQMAHHVSDPEAGSINTAFESLPITYRRGEWGSNGIVQMVADTNRFTFDIGDRQVNQRILNIAEKHGARGRMEKLGRFKTYWINPESGRREVHPKLRDIIELNTKRSGKDDGMFYQPDGDYVYVMKVLDNKLATQIRTNQTRQIVDQVYRPLGNVEEDGAIASAADKPILGYTGMIQGKMLTTYNPVFYLRDYQRNFGNAMAKMGNLHGFREMATFAANQPRFLASAIRQAWQGGIDVGRPPDDDFQRVQRDMREQGFHTQRVQAYGRFGANKNILDEVTRRQQPLRSRGRAHLRALDQFWTNLAAIPEQAVRVGYAHAVNKHADTRRRQGFGDDAATYQRAMFEAQNLTNFKLQGAVPMHGLEVFFKPSVNSALDAIDFWKNGRNNQKMFIASVGWGAIKYKLLLMAHAALYGDEGVERFLDTPDETEVRGLPIYTVDKNGKLSDEAIMIEHHYGGGIFTWLGGYAAKWEARREMGMESDTTEIPGLLKRALANHWSPADADLFTDRNFIETALAIASPVLFEPAIENFGQDDDVPLSSRKVRDNTNQVWVDLARKQREWTNYDLSPRQIENSFRLGKSLVDGVAAVYDVIAINADDIDDSIISAIPGINLSSRRVGRDVVEDFYHTRGRVRGFEKQILRALEDREVGDNQAYTKLNDSVVGSSPTTLYDNLKGLESEIDQIDNQIQDLNSQRSFARDDPRRRSPNQIRAAVGDLRPELYRLMNRYRLLGRALP